MINVADKWLSTTEPGLSADFDLIFNGVSVQLGVALLSWYDQHGRKDLPWQQNPTLYRVWVSEIMLQQTQVSTVLRYYSRFMQSFPTLQALATADLNEVLHHWTGLGYYARARNLHKAAQQILLNHNGIFPTNLAALMDLPGIGRSTAGAILSLGLNEPYPILDGNVKRVFTRFFGIHGVPTAKNIEEQLWQLATTHAIKQQRSSHYTQALMDLGATVCTRTQPACQRCPLKKQCVAFQNAEVHLLPTKKHRAVLPEKKRFFVILLLENRYVYLTQRSLQGIWGGLWCFPECENSEQVIAITRKILGIGRYQRYTLETYRHTFTHFHLDISPVIIKPCNRNITLPLISEEGCWYDLHDVARYQLGFAAPTQKLLNYLREVEWQNSIESESVA